MSNDPGKTVPARIELPSIGGFFTYLILVMFLIYSFTGTGISLTDFVDGIPAMGRIVSEMLPPNLDRLDQILLALLETFSMAFAGAVVGVFIALFLAIFAARNTSPHFIVYFVMRSVVTFIRTVPELVWAIIFVASVGLGPFAGMLAIVVDTIGFCTRFFAEAMEEVDPGPQEALTALGANRPSIIFCSVIPSALPSIVNTSMYSLEKAVRASVILGLVGAGGIGIELKSAMDMFMYDEAATIIISIFVLILTVEQVSSRLRQRIIKNI